MSKWLRIPLGGIQRNVPSHFTGATMDVLNAESRTVRDGLTARFEDVIESDANGDMLLPDGYDTPRQIAQATDVVNNRPVTVALIEHSAGIDRFLVRGHSKLDGTLIPGDTGLDGWTAPPDAQMQSTFGSVETDGREVRLHGSDPKYFGLPKAITDVVHTDWEYAHYDQANGTDNQIGYRPSFVINGPFPAPLGISKPRLADIRLYPIDNPTFQWRDGRRIAQDITFTDAPFWGDPTASSNPRFQYAYWAISFMHDGTQEGPLRIISIPDEPCLGTNGGESALRIKRRFHFQSISYPSETRGINERIRTIRIYCCPSTSLLGDPATEGRFYLASELDVRTCEMKSTTTLWNFAAERVVNAGGYGGQWLKMRATPDLVDRSFEAGTDFHLFKDLLGGNEPDENDVGGQYENLAQGWRNYAFKLTDTDDPNEPEFYIWDARCRHIDGEDNHNPALYIKVMDNQATDLVNRFPSANPDASSSDFNKGTIRPIKIYQRWRWPVNAIGPSGIPTVDVWAGDELLLRPTYSDLSGLPQTCPDGISPARRWGTSATSVPVIGQTTDYLGKFHASRLHKAMFSPSAILTPDRFDPFDDFVDLDFVPVTAVPHRGLDAVFGRNRIELRSFADSMKRVSKAWPGIGTVSYKSVVTTPDGVFFLSDDGVRMLVGYEVSEPMSDSVKDMLDPLRDQWPNAIGGYHARLSEYHLFIPQRQDKVDEAGEKGTTFIYSLITKEWSRLSTPRTVTAMCESVEGTLLVARNDPSDHANRAIWESQVSSKQSQTAKIVVRLVFGAPGIEKHIARLRAFFVSAGGDPFTVELAPEDAVKSPTYVYDALVSGQSNESAQLNDRMFTLTASNFATLEAVEVEYDELARVA